MRREDSAPPPLDYRTPGPTPTFWARLDWPVVVVITLGGLLALVVAVPMPPRNSGGTSNRAKCCYNEHQLGLAILLYQQDHYGQHPESLAAILSDEQIGPEVFICPSSNDTPATLPPPPAGQDRPTTRQAAAALAVPGHESYLYFGHADWTDATVLADAVVIAEPPSSHAGDGSNILFGDGHAECIPMPRAARLIAAASATTRPVYAASVR